ncbi:MAG: phosphoribosylglycinamide formyltransferase [Candidatus Omnitrophica bacterium]|nr:phosphoribosylglycinamide formyltransferase [Candidatus Omnitrophota bacterium]MBI2495645.1 phosphoribosylglycinamide formyltransferase [Candidatus Omnitrophota bacterium]MBI3020504.1 phosphoribosylglycinamide formyltransferase [Candidatus Omnitrophota bacterium]MBI3082954.1 phosphoribosylglycinamide formyltransferase [Candidatus Omnitrophota bacterium]
MRLARGVPAIAVFCSGEGTNLQAILDATRAGRLRARVALVVSDQPDAKALLRAKRAGVETRCYINPREYPTREAFERALIALCEYEKVRLVCLAGFMRMLSPVFVRRYRHRILNIHPALLPAFPGAHPIRDALQWGVKVTGVTVHLVDEAMDHGPIVLQEALAIRPGETATSLLARLHTIEHRLYAQAIRLMLERRTRIVGRTVTIR